MHTLKSKFTAEEKTTEKENENFDCGCNKQKVFNLFKKRVRLSLTEYAILSKTEVRKEDLLKTTLKINIIFLVPESKKLTYSPNIWYKYICLNRW